MKEHCRLGDIGPLELELVAFKHDVSEPEAKDFVGFLEKLAGYGVLLIEVVTHAYELGTLAGENVCCHIWLKAHP